MNWEDLQSNSKTKEIALHWQKLSAFRKNHFAIGAGMHTQISSKPYVFSRTYTNKISDKVIVGLDLKVGKKTISVGTIFTNGDNIKDAYSGSTTKVKEGKATFNTPFTILLLEKM
jgi:alpha-amylase